MTPFPEGVRGVLFDAGNTLLWIDHARLAEALRTVGLTCGESEVRRAEMLARPRLDPHLGKAPKRESPEVFGRYVGFILEGLGVSRDAAVHAAAYQAVAAVWGSLWVRPPEDAHRTLGALRERGYRLGVVSNSDGRVGRRLADVGLHDFFHCVVDSGEEGIEKPDPRIFAAAAERIGFPPAELVYVGDFHSLDVLGARGAGIHAILIDPIDCWDVDVPRIRALSDLLDTFPGPPD